MDCSLAAEYITPYIDQELSDIISAQIDEHVGQCENCRIELQAQLGLHRLLSEKLERKTAPESLKRKIVNGIAHQRVFSPSWLFKKIHFEMRPLSGLAVAALLLLSVFSRDVITMITPERSAGIGAVPVVERNYLTGRSLQTIDIKDGVNASIVGRVICIGCYLRENFHAHYDCGKHGHHIGFLTEDGNLWSFTENGESGKIIEDKNLYGKTIKIDGQIFYTAHYIDVNAFQFLSEDE